METVKHFFKSKSYGFFASILVLVFSLVTAVIYIVSYSNSNDMSWPVFIAIIAGVLLALTLVGIKRYNWVPAALALGNFFALLLFIRSIYFYVSVVLYGINGSAFSPAFMSSTLFLLLSVIFSVANIFMKQVEE